MEIITPTTLEQSLEVIRSSGRHLSILLRDGHIKVEMYGATKTSLTNEDEAQFIRERACHLVNLHKKG